MDDFKIVNLFWERDEKAIEWLDKKYRNYLLSIARNIVSNPQDSEECLNDAYLSVWNAIPPNRPDNLLSFVVTIIRRISISRYRKNNAEKQIPSEYVVSMEELGDCFVCNTLEEEYEAARITQAISEYLRKLSAYERSVFICRYYCSDSIESIAKAFGKSKVGIYKKLTAIRRNLKVYLKKKGIIY